ncbi:MAG: alpha/beta hydrolase [Pseudomonadota bacterium]|nr:alpha/beta hydrolase [Pseudomonadota bacterium]
MNSKLKQTKKIININHLPATKPSNVCFVMAHGWRRTHEDFKAIASQITDLGDQYLIDLPAHGDTCASSANLTIDEYLLPIIEFVRSIDKPIIWVGHSFGCRIGSHIGRHCPEKIKALFFICPPYNTRRHWHYKYIFKSSKQFLYKLLILLGMPRKSILPWFASKDYVDSGHMRELFKQIVNEDSGFILSQLTMPLTLVFAENDEMTPPELSKHIQSHCKHATSSVLRYFDHNSILTDGQYQIIHKLMNFSKELE